MRVCFDSNCFAVLLDKATTGLMSQKGEAIPHAQERLESFIAVERPEILLPSVIYWELLMISSVSQADLDAYLFANSSFIMASFDFRAATELFEVEKPTKGKRLDRVETMAKIRFDRQILAISKFHQVDLIITTDNGFDKDAKRFGLNTRCASTLPIADSLAQHKLELVHDSAKHPAVSKAPLRK